MGIDPIFFQIHLSKTCRTSASFVLFFFSLLFIVKQRIYLCILGTLEKLLLLALYQDFTYVSTILKQDNRRVATRF